MTCRTLPATVAGLFLAWIAAVGLTSQTAVAAAQGNGNPDAKNLKNPVAASPESITAGRQLYMKQCSFCHGSEGKGDGPQAPPGATPADLTDVKWDHGSSDGEIFTVISEGIGPKFDMDSYKGKFKDEQIWNLVNFVRTLAPAPK